MHQATSVFCFGHLTSFGGLKFEQPESIGWGGCTMQIDWTFEMASTQS